MKYLLLLTLLLFSGCSLFKEKEPIIIPTYIKVVCEKFDKIESITPLPVKWVQAVDEQGNIVLGLSGSDYSNLAINSRETLRYIKSQNKAIVYYEECIEDHNSKLQ